MKRRPRLWMIRTREGPNTTTNKVRASQAREPLAHRLLQAPFCLEFAVELSLGAFLVGDAHPQLPVEFLDGVPPQLPVGLSLGAFLAGDVRPQRPVELQPLGGGVLPRLLVALLVGAFLVGAVLLQLLVDLSLSAAVFFLSYSSGLLLELSLSAMFILSHPSGFGLLSFLRRQPWLLQCFSRCSRKASPPAVQPRSMTDRGVANSAIARIGDCR